jgi:CBS domain containing-hemolysin-like protein
MVLAHRDRRNAGHGRGLESAPMDGIQVVDIAHAIQLAVAPVFLLSGIGVLLGVLTNRLAHIVDRARKVEESVRQATAPDHEEARAQLRVAQRRARFINASITLSTIAALLIALVVALLFASTFVPLSLAAYVALLFVLAMIALIGGLLSFLIEVRIATAALRIGGR